MRINAEYARMDEQEWRDLAPLLKRLSAGGRAFTVHIATRVDRWGHISPLCMGDDDLKLPRPLEYWVYSPNLYEHVTCASCMAAKESELSTPERTQEEG